MLRCLFWNVQKKNLVETLLTAIKLNSLGIVLTCEDIVPEGKVLGRLSSEGDFVSLTGRLRNRLRIYTKYSREYFTLLREHERCLIYQVSLPAYKPFLLMLVHLPSKRTGNTGVSAAISAGHFMGYLRLAELETGIVRSLIVGDFNMNPYEAGMVSAGAFNGLMDARQVRKGSRVINGETHRLFYNPMWNLLGDAKGPPGTMFYNQGVHEDVGWHMLDQVILSPEMLDSVPTASISILEKIGETSLCTTHGRPKQSLYSDHFPILFEIHS